MIGLGFLLAHCSPPETVGGTAGTAGAAPDPILTPTPGDIGIPVDDDCDGISDAAHAAACRAFMVNERQYVLPALEDVSGLRFRDCLTRIRFEFNTATTNLGQAYQEGGIGIIQFNTTLTSQYFTASPPLAFDDHEPVHLLFQCAHIPQTFNNHHVFFFAAQAQIDERIYERSGHALTLARELMVNNRRYVNDWFLTLTNEPSRFNPDVGGQFAGCPGAISYILFADYRRPHYNIVHDWLMAVHADSALAGLSYTSSDADQRFLQVMVNLMTPTPAMHAFLSPYCPALPSR